MTGHLVANVPGFTDESARALTEAMTEAFPVALVEPTVADYARIGEVRLPDEGDRHVVAAALAAEAHIVCTSNIRHFPPTLMARLGLLPLTPDELFTHLMISHTPQMVAAHGAVVVSFSRATDASTLAALRRAGAVRTADLMARALGVEGA